jgi:alpha-tubulin suppressor-like RCC1 family protein
MVSVASQIDFAADIEAVAASTPARSEFEDGFKHSLASSLGDGSTVRPEAVFVDEISEAAAMQAAMFGGARPPLNPLEPLLPAVGVHFHIAVPEGLQTTTVSLMETLQQSDESLEVVVDGATLVADTASLVAPVWISMGGQCDFASTSDGDHASEAPLPDPNTDTFLQAQPEIAAHSWVKCFDSDVDDASTPAVFHTQCDEFAETVTVVWHGPVPETGTQPNDVFGWNVASPRWEEGAGWIFGGYAQQSWNKDTCCAEPLNDCPEQYCRDHTSAANFIFGLEPGEPARFNPLAAPVGSNARQWAYQNSGPDYCPAWGTISDELHTGNVGPPGTRGRCMQGQTFAGSYNEICGTMTPWGETRLQVWRRVSPQEGPPPPPAEPGMGTMWTFGSNGSGQLGDGSTSDRASPAQVASLGDDNAVVVCGEYFTVVLKSDGRVFAFGWNGHGELGDGSTSTRTSPVQASLPAGAEVTQLHAGHHYVLALRQDGTVLHWGDGTYGQAGDGGTSPQCVIPSAPGARCTPTPHQIAPLGSDNALVSGAGDTCLVLKADGALWAWGYNEFGQLADGTTTDRPTPAQISSVGTDNAFVTGGNYHVLLLKADGALMGWGYNRWGQLGNGNTDNQHSPIAISVPGAPVVQVSAGYHESYATAADGTVYAWGKNDYYSLGDGTTTNRHSPVAVSGLQADPAAQLATSHLGYHMLVLQPDGTAVGWGQNDHGQVGDGGTSNVQTAQDITALGQGNAAIAIGGYHTAVLKRP